MSPQDAVRAVVADDNADNVRVLVDLLKLLGCDAHGCFDGEHCVELARTHQPQLILVDLAMPRMDGFAVASRLRDEELPPHMLIALSGYGDIATKQRCHDAGFHSHVIKPIEAQHLKHLIGAAQLLRAGDR